MILHLLLGAALAAEPPPAPEPVEPTGGQCAKSYPFEEGSPLHPDVLDGDVASCSGVLVPTSTLANLLNQEAHARHLEELYRVDTSDLESDLRVQKAQNEALSRPVPWLSSPRGQRWVGRAEVVGVVIAIAATSVYISKSTQ